MLHTLTLQQALLPSRDNSPLPPSRILTICLFPEPTYDLALPIAPLKLEGCICLDLDPHRA